MNLVLSPPEPLDITGYKFASNISGTLVFNTVKKSTVELSHGDLLSVYKSSFAKMPISNENMNLFWSDLVTLFPE